MKKIVVCALLALGLLVGACRQPNVAGQCEDPPRCITGLECSYDRVRGCNVCRCKTPPTGAPETVPGTPPVRP